MSTPNGKFKAEINVDLLYEGVDGREAFCMLNSPGKIAIVTDIHNQGQPFNCVVFTPADLRALADKAEQAWETMERQS